VARVTGRRNAYRVLAGKLERKMPLEDPNLGRKKGIARQATYVYLNTKERSRNHCCCEKSTNY